MVSVTVEFVSVCVVIEPWVKFGTTGTALAAVPQLNSNIKGINLFIVLS